MFRILRGYCIKLKKYLADNKWFALNYQIKSKPIYVNVVLLNLIFFGKSLTFMSALYSNFSNSLCTVFIKWVSFSKSHY